MVTRTNVRRRLARLLAILPIAAAGLAAVTLGACSNEAHLQSPRAGVATTNDGRAPFWPALDADAGAPVVDEWYSDIPWHQKLGTYAGNEIDEALLLPYAALPKEAQDLCAGMSRPSCMIEVGVLNILSVHRLDRLYSANDPKITAAEECKNKDQPCIEVMLELSSVWARAQGTNVVLAPRPFGNHFATPPPDGSDPAPTYYGGYQITDGSTYGPQMPWYMAHYCDGFYTSGDSQDPVCYADYFSPMNDGFNPLPGTAADQWPRSVPWSVWPWDTSKTTPPPPPNVCPQQNNGQPATTCTMVLAGFPFTELPPTQASLQYPTYNGYLLTWFNGALAQFPKDLGKNEHDRHFPWGGATVSWEGFLYPQGAQNPFLGQYATSTPPGLPSPPGCQTNVYGSPDGGPICANTGNVMAATYLYPRQCTLTDLANGDAARLRRCSLNYELHHNGYYSQWPNAYWSSVRGASMIANQYGRTSFLFAGVPGMQMPVTFAKALCNKPNLCNNLSVYEQVNNASIFSLFLPIANEADTKRAMHDRNYTDDFYHTLLMSNHMESDQGTFADGIRGKVLWHNEYRMKGMYSPPNPSAFPTETFQASFDATNAPAPFHNNTCDSCHVRNGSGVPINTAGKLDPNLLEFMNASYNAASVPDYTFTGQIRPMKLVFFDLTRAPTRAHTSVYSEPLVRPAKVTGSVQPGALYYGSKVLNFYGDSFHVTRPGYSYSWSYEDVDPSRLVVSTPRVNQELGKTYKPSQIKLGTFQTPANCQLVTPSPTTKPWPASCQDINGAAISNAIKAGTVGYMLLNGKRLGNLSAIEAIPNNAIQSFQRNQGSALGAAAGEILWSAGTRDGVNGTVQTSCLKNTLLDCFIGRFGWLGDRASLEDQVANAAFIEMNMTSSQGYDKLYPSGTATDPIRYKTPNCGPADKACVEAKANSDLTERDIGRMANYARWVGNPTRSDFQVSLPDVIAGEQVFRDTQCHTCHVIDRIDINPDDTMLAQPFRDRLSKRVSGPAKPFLSYIGTDLLVHDMGYLSQVGITTQAIRGPDGVVLPAYQSFVQKVRTPALKGLRFNRFVTDSYKNTKLVNPGAPPNPACDFLLHDGRACDAIEAAFLHDGPAVKKLGTIDKLNKLSPNQLLALRAFLYSL